MLRYVLPFALALTAATSAFAADIGLTPPRFHVTVAPGERTVLTFSLLTSIDAEQAVEIEIADWTFDALGNASFLRAGTLAHSASPWIELESDGVILGPEPQLPLRVEVAVPHEAEGTHHAIVFFSVTPDEAGNTGVGVTTTTRVGLTVYVTVAGTERGGSELVDLYQPDPTTLAAVVLNTGNTVMRLGGAIELRNEAGDVVHRLPVPDVPILRESEREVRFDLPADLDPGFYVVLALIEDDRGGLLAGELPIEIP